MKIIRSIQNRLRETWCRLTKECNSETSHHNLAMALSIGIFFGMSPFLGIRAILVFFAAWAFRVNRLIAALLAALHEVFIPFFPLLLYWQHEIGRRVFGESAHSHDYLCQKPNGYFGLLEKITEEGGALLTGGLIFSLIAASFSYFILRLVFAQMSAQSQHLSTQ